MVTQAAIQAHINKGYSKASTRLGASYAQYRAAGFVTPIDPANQVGSLFVDFDATSAFAFTAPVKTSTDIYYGLMDLTNVLAGDYLAGPQGTFFVSEIEPLKPPVCIRCAQTLTFAAGPGLKVGSNAYREHNGTQDTYYGKLFPASVLIDRERGGKPLTNLPNDVISRLTFKALLSPSFGSGNPKAMQPGDTVTDATATRYQVYEALWHPTGWQLRLERLM